MKYQLEANASQPKSASRATENYATFFFGWTQFPISMARFYVSLVSTILKVPKGGGKCQHC